MLTIQVQQNKFQPRKSFLKQPNFSEMVNCSPLVELEFTASRLHVECSNRWATGMGHFVNLWFGSLALAIYIGLITVTVFTCWRLDYLNTSAAGRDRVTQMVSKLGHHYLRQWLVAWSVSSHCLSHCWLNFSLSFDFNCNHSTRSWICTGYDNRVNSLKPSDAYMRQ